MPFAVISISLPIANPFSFAYFAAIAISLSYFGNLPLNTTLGLFTFEKSSQSVAIRSTPPTCDTFKELYKYTFSVRLSEFNISRKSSSTSVCTLIALSVVSPMIRSMKGVISTIMFSIISPENTTTSERTSIVIQTVILCLTPESVVLSASAKFKGALVFSSGTRFFLKLCVRTPERNATIGSIFFILRAESKTERATVHPNIISEIITGNGKK